MEKKQKSNVLIARQTRWYPYTCKSAAGPDRGPWLSPRDPHSSRPPWLVTRTHLWARLFWARAEPGSRVTRTCMAPLVLRVLVVEFGNTLWLCKYVDWYICYPRSFPRRMGTESSTGLEPETSSLDTNVHMLDTWHRPLTTEKPASSAFVWTW